MVVTLLLALSAPPAAVAPAPRLVGELVELKTATGTLRGTIDLPATPGPWPVVLIHAGSGPTDRDGNGPGIGTDCLKQTGRALAKHGIAALRIDKRGIGGSAGAMKKEEDLRIDTYSDDVLTWVAGLRKDGRFAKIGYIGHSEGSTIGLIAAKEVRFDSFVSLCGPARTFQELLREQLKKNLPAETYKECDKIITELEAGHTVKEPPKSLAALFRPSVQPYLISSFQHDPTKLANAVRSPLLIIGGETDIQVPPTDAKLFGTANPKARVVIIDDMNHVLKVAKETNRLTQLPTYLDRTVPLHPKLMPELVRFFQQSLAK